METVFDVIIVCIGVCVLAYAVLVAHLYYLENMLEEDTE